MMASLIFCLCMGVVFVESWRSFSSVNRLKSTALFQVVNNEAGVAFTKIFIGNLPFSITNEDIQKLIDDNVGEGLVKSIQIAIGKKSKAPRGFAFVDMIDEEAAATAASVLNEVTFQDRLLNSNVKDDNPDESKRKRTRVNAHTAFVTNIDTSLDESEVMNMCNDILGPYLVVSLQMPLDINTNRPRGIAYIEFINKETVEKAIKEFNGLEVLGRILVCDIYKPKKVDKNIPKLKPPSANAGSSSGGGDDELNQYFN